MPGTTLRSSNRRVVAIATIALLIAAACGAWLSLRTYHLAAVRPGVLYRCGNRGMAEFSNAVGRIHPRTVVSLIDDRELADPAKPQFRSESAYLQDHGIRQVRIPVPLGGWPNSDDIHTFLAIVEDPTNQPVLVHCAQGVRRTGMFVAAYQRSALGVTAAQAKDAVQSFGHSAAIIADIDRFIDAYDPSTGTIVGPLPTTRPGAAE